MRKKGTWAPDASLYIYDIATDTFSKGPDIPREERYTKTALLNGRLYLYLGGDHEREPKLYSLDVSGEVPPPEKKVQVLLAPGETAQLALSHNVGANRAYGWHSRNETVARVNADGLVTGVAPGETSIAAENAAQGFSESVPVKVTDAQPKLGLYLPGRAQQACWFAPGNVEWSTTDEEVATVDTKGIVTGEAFGNTQVHARQEGAGDELHLWVGGAA